MLSQLQLRQRFHITLTQRQAALAVLALYFLGTVLVIVIELVRPTVDAGFYLFGAVVGAILFGGTWMLYYKRNWEAVRYFAAIASTLLVALLLPEPFVSVYAPMIIVIPIILALILSDSFWVIINAFLTIGVLLIRAEGKGVYANPATLTFYAMIVGGFLVRRLIEVTSLRQVEQAQEEIKQSETRFRSLIENGSDEISIIDADGTLLYESPSSNPTLGYHSSAFLGKNLWQLIHPDDLKRMLDVFAELIREPELHLRERFRLLDSNGTWRWIEAVGTNLLHEPSVRGIVINYHDVTESKQAEESLRQAQARNESILASVADAHILFDRQWRYLYVNDVAVNSISKPREQILGHTLWELYPDIVGTELERQYRCAMDENVPVAFEFHYSGRDTWWENRFFPVPEGLSVFGTDISERKRYEQELQSLNTELEKRVTKRTEELNQTNIELEHANQAKDEFLANMSHELRTPLNSILGLSQSLLEQRRGSLNESQQRSLNVIESSGHHLLELINDILDLSKIEAGKFDFYPEPISIDEFCQSCLTFVKTQAMQKSITITYIKEPVVSRVFADPRRLKQILVNLLTNAVKFTLEKGKVVLEVHADPEQDLIQFSVIDNGIGIAPDDLQRLFQPFMQVDSSLNREYEGTGLGLALVQKLTDLHGGSVHVETEKGKGSCFTINIPSKQSEMAKLENVQSSTAVAVYEQTKIEHPLQTATKRGTILLAEDNVANVLTIGEYLESHGYEVIVAHDGLEAVEKTEAINPNIILMDIQMPAMDGIEAIVRLRADARFGSTPIIALTALAMPGDRERCLQAGASEYMSKPVGLKSLKQMIQILLEAQPAN